MGKSPYKKGERLLVCDSCMYPLVTTEAGESLCPDCGHEMRLASKGEDKLLASLFFPEWQNKREHYQGSW